MKVSIRVGFTKPGAGEHPLEPGLKLASELGFDGIELCLEPKRWDVPSAWSEDLSRRDRATIRKLAERYGLEIATLSSDWPGYYSSFCPRLRHWERGLEILKSDIELAEDLGAKAILVHFAGARGTLEQAKEMLSELAYEGERRDVRVGYESGLWTRYLGTLEDLCRIVDEVGSKYLGVYLHNWWPRSGRPPHEEIELVGDRIVCLHSSEIDLENVDYRLMLTTLKKYYDWYWVFEVELKDAKKNLELWRRLMAEYW